MLELFGQRRQVSMLGGFSRFFIDEISSYRLHSLYSFLANGTFVIDIHSYLSKFLLGRKFFSN